LKDLAASPLAGLWKVLYLSFYAGPISMGTHGPRLIVLYSLLPWVGVMALGYAFGRVLALPRERRDALCLRLGLGALLLFALLRGFNLYGDPFPWSSPTGGPGSQRPVWMAFLNTTKYPASLAFLLMTLGPTLLALPFLDRARGALAEALRLFGRVPFFFYLLHIPLIHLLALGVSKFRLGEVHPWLFANHPMGAPPAPGAVVWSLPLLYGIWIFAVALLYLPCRGYAAFKARHSEWWWSYL
jgi:hypothetical protein